MDDRDGPRDEGVIASVRRILGADAARQRAARGEGESLFARPEPVPSRETAGVPADDDVLELETAMMIDEQAGREPGTPADATATAAVPAPQPPVSAPAGSAPSGAAPAGSALGSLRAALRDQRSHATLVSRNGATIEELIREELRPLLKEWLDQHLPPMVERIARAEIARIVEREGA